MGEQDAHNVKQDMKIEYLEERIIKNEEVIAQLAEGQIAMQQSMTEINTTLNLLLKMGKPALMLLAGVLAAMGIDITGVVN
jgi:uncharacterized coiled-coil protein SlyX